MMVVVRAANRMKPDEPNAKIAERSATILDSWYRSPRSGDVALSGVSRDRS